MEMGQLYGDDLARIHIDGYGFHWESAAPAILKRLRNTGIHSGVVIDLGCGGGQWLARLAAEGYMPVGVDVSSAMIRSASKRIPSAQLIHGSFAEVELPKCDAVTSIGEPLNYLPTRKSFQRTLKNVYHALRPGGLFIFDVRIPPTAPVEARTAVRISDDWACLAIIDEDYAKQRITRRIATFCRRGSAYRRSDETHILRLYPKSQLARWLRQIGFRVRILRSYGRYKLMPRQVVIVARKPT
jgi:SAM-dependent methyltransferase